MDLDAGWAKVATDWAQFLATGAVGAALTLWATLGRRDRSMGEQIDTIKARLVHTEHQTTTVPERCHTHVARLAAIEEAIRRSPHHTDLDALREKHEAGLLRVHERVDRIEKSLGRIEGQLMAISATLNRLTQHQLEHGPRAGDH